MLSVVTVNQEWMVNNMAKCLDCIHQCYTEPTEEACNFFIDKNKYVEVVRCKDCKHFMSDICYFDMGLHFCRGDDFCSYGEPKTET